MGHWRLERRDRIAVATFSAPPRNFMTFADMTERRTWSNKVLFAVSAEAQTEVLDSAVAPALERLLEGAAR